VNFSHLPLRRCAAVTALLAGLLITGLSRAQPSTLISYDTANHLIQATATTGSAIQYQYDLSGNVINLGTLSPTALTLGVQQGVTVGTVGQAALLRFSATTGESATLNLGSIVTTPANTPVTIGVYDSTGTLVGSTISSTNPSLTLNNLAGGNYIVVVTPQNGATGSLQLASSGTGGGGSSGNGSDAPLPLWAYVVLGAGLLWIGVRKQRPALS